MIRTIHIVSCLCVLAAAPLIAQDGWTADPIAYRFTGRYGQVEVGGPNAAAEFHGSLPLPSRISFFSPVANSIDLSTDYWKRGDSHPFRVGLAMNGKSRRWIGTEPWEYVLSPHCVTFRNEDAGVVCTMKYEFGLTEPVMAFRCTVVNSTSGRMHLDATVRIATTLRTCQTYARLDSALVAYDSSTGGYIAQFGEPQTAGTSVFLLNAGDGPSGHDSSDEQARTRAEAGFSYERTLDAHDSLTIVLLIGSCRNTEAPATMQRLQHTWAADLAAYDRFIRDKAEHGAELRTGDAWVDRTVPWANAILAANAHFLDGAVVPMPCPAEYNFFFTHDMLLTDLAAAMFDPGRVKRDLSYIASLARDSVIPHARYWKDDGFKTEFCTPDNWNHLWFILVAGCYLRHTGDMELGRRLYPLLFKSMGDALLRLRDDHLMYALAPDWWDIGKNAGPRAYMTVLVIRALREFAYIGALLNVRVSDFARGETIASNMTASLGNRLWDEQSQYLMNYNGPDKDPHIYMGSLLAPVFGLLDSVRATQLIRTAGRRLLAEGLGIRTVTPQDFHTDSLRTYFHFAGNEAGDPYLYANGGVWPHNNAWYALALSATGRIDDAFRFYRTTMTLDGIAHSPMGQPAFYEYRFSDPASRQYGAIDKPSFLWAAGFNLLVGYRLMGIQENEWNISFSPQLPSAIDTGRCAVEFGGRKEIAITGKGTGLRSFTADGREIPSLVVPLDIRNTRRWTVSHGSPREPYLAKINAQLRSAAFNRKNRTLNLNVVSFKGHQVVAAVVVVDRVRRVRVDHRETTRFTLSQGTEGTRELTLRFEGSKFPQDVVIEF